MVASIVCLHAESDLGSPRVQGEVKIAHLNIGLGGRRNASWTISRERFHGMLPGIFPGTFQWRPTVAKRAKGRLICMVIKNKIVSVARFWVVLFLQ